MKQKTIGIISLMTVMIFAMATVAWAGSYKIQYPAGTDIFVVDTLGNVNADGSLMENNTLLTAKYWQIADVQTPANGVTTKLSTADHIYDYIVSLNYVANAWDALTDMALADGQIYIGDASNDPVARAVSGHATITNTGVVSVVNTAGLSASNITTGEFADARFPSGITRDTELTNFWDEDADINADEISENKINFATACGPGNHYYLNGNDLACETDDDTTYTANTPLNLTGTVFDLIDCADTQIYKMSGGAWTCSADGGAGLNNVIEDITPQLGGNLDVNDFGIDGGGSTNMTIDATGNFIIVLS